MDCINRYFPHLSDKQKSQFEALYSLYAEWNERINVISRKDIDNLYERHILHSLAIAQYIQFKDGSEVLDIGTGGGLPGIPLAILFPKVRFTLIDSIGKKIKVGTAIAKEIGLTNVELRHQRVQENKEKYDFVVSRAVMQLEKLSKLCRKNISKKQQNAIANGLICLKGGTIDEEIKPFSKIIDVVNISDYFQEEFFETKKVVYLPI